MLRRWITFRLAESSRHRTPRLCVCACMVEGRQPRVSCVLRDSPDFARTLPESRFLSEWKSRAQSDLPHTRPVAAHYRYHGFESGTADDIANRRSVLETLELLCRVPLQHGVVFVCTLTATGSTCAAPCTSRHLRRTAASTQSKFDWCWRRGDASSDHRRGQWTGDKTVASQ